MNKIVWFYLFITFLLLFKYSHFPATTYPCHTHPHLPPSILSLFGFVHVSFIHVPWWPFPFFPPLSLSLFVLMWRTHLSYIERRNVLGLWLQKHWGLQWHLSVLILLTEQNQSNSSSTHLCLFLFGRYKSTYMLFHSSPCYFDSRW